MSQLADVWREELAQQRERVSIPIWRLGIGSGIAAGAGHADHGFWFWFGLLLTYAILLGPYSVAKWRERSHD